MSDAGGTAERWAPTRAGIRNIWEYDDQVFEFAGGRLVLRGPNGSGKSNALALLVPFLFDATMSARRMDSLAGGRSMKTLLLCLADDDAGPRRFRHDQRTGYAWLELCRVGRFKTIGCGARASLQRDAEAWFFVTDRRPGHDLDLAPGGVPLSRGGLLDVLGPGAVFDTADAYRAALDRELFDLGPERFRNLVELLLVLRRPHLAGKLDLDRLSGALSDGLAPLDSGLVAGVAASFDDLEAVQRDLARLQDALASVETFLPTYRRYLRASAKTRAEAVLAAGRDLRAAHKHLAAAAGAAAAADTECESVRAEKARCADDREVAEQRRLAVLDSPAYRDAHSLGEARNRAAESAAVARGAGQRLRAAEESATAAAREADSAADDVRGARAALDRGFATAAAAADAAGVAWTATAADAESPDLDASLRAGAARRREDVRVVVAVRADVDVARTRSEAAAATAEASAVTAEATAAARARAGEAVDDARDTLRDAVAAWAAATDVDGLHEVVDAVDGVGEAGAPSLPDVLAAALLPRRQSLAAAAARADDRRAALLAETAACREEREKVADEAVPAPEPAATRPAARAGRPGAPLYACCDFAPGVAAGERAGLEAALDAAGVLDAWIDPAATPSHGGGDLDAWIRPGDPVTGPSLSDLLVPTPPEGSGLSPADVEAVLATIALADAGVGVLADGRFALGPLQGRYAKATAEFVGAAAREARRQRLLEELDARLASLAGEVDDVVADLGDVAARQEHLAAAERDLPPSTALLEARDALLRAAAAASAASEAAERDARLAAAAAAGAAAAERRLRSLAGERSLPTDSEGLAAVTEAVRAFEEVVAGLRRLAGELGAHRRAETAAAARHDHSREVVAARRDEDEQAARHARGLAARVETLEAHLGPDAEAPLRELAAVEADVAALVAELAVLDRRAVEAAQALGAARARQDAATVAVGEKGAAVESSAQRLTVLRRADVWDVLAPGDAPAADAMAVARRVAEATTGVEGGGDGNALQRAFRSLLDELGRGHDPSLSYVDDLGVVEVTSEAGTFPIGRLAATLAAQVARQQELLSERDREIFERHLLTRISEGLRDLLNDTDEFVARVNSCLQDAPTASGLRVQLRWELDSSDPAVRRALGLLRRTPELLGPDEREDLRRFFAASIAQRRAEDPSVGYAEVLRAVLDYRAWHMFVPYVVSAAGGRQRLTPTLFRSLSGGEQAVALHLPLFAAAAAHYDAAAESAPRLVALDEAFAGIDEGMRAELMGLLVRFDLDVVLTGHELWGAYEDVPAIMVYDLLRRPPAEGVSAMALRWDGRVMAEA